MTKARTVADVIRYLCPQRSDVTGEEESDYLSSLESDSRKVTAGAAFIAVPGAHDGHAYIKDALLKGARLVIVTKEEEVPDAVKADPLYKERALVPEIPVRVGEFAAWFYDSPSLKMRVLGVTGTNGKSTVTHMLASLLESEGKKCAIFGTLGNGFLGSLHKSPNTTLEPVELQKELAAMADQGATWVAMEVSSIGVCEGRVEGIFFRGGGFTNLTRDHLDYHKTEAAYFEAKKRFLKTVPARNLCVNDNDPRAQEIYGLLPGSVAYGVGPRPPAFIDQKYVWVNKVSYLPAGMKLSILSSWGEGECTLNLLGRFNAENFACALAMLLTHGHPLPVLLKAASRIKPVPGRMECFVREGLPRLIVDYAHTPDGIECALKAVREHSQEGRVTIVMGCGGDRDPGKRAIMAMKASVYADRLIFTNDNPRTEDPERILSDMLLGIPKSAPQPLVIKDRKEAILTAFREAGPQDVVLIAGKGHEDYQIFKDRTEHFSDREIASTLLQEAEVSHA